MSIPVVRCTLLAIRRINPKEFSAEVIRHDNHPVLGPPNGKTTRTSPIRVINFQMKWIVTQNTVYDFSGD